MSLLCRLLEVSRSGYYAWTRRAPSKRQLADEVLAEQIKGFHEASRKTYGAPRIWLALRDADVHVGRKRVARLMRANGWQGVHRRSWGTPRGRTRTRCRRRTCWRGTSPRRGAATAPSQKCVADVTYVPTVAGWLYLATVLDVFSRRIVGWSMDSHRKTQLVCDAVSMAVANRGGQVAGVVHHSDHGGEYSSRDLEAPQV